MNEGVHMKQLAAQNGLLHGLLCSYKYQIDKHVLLPDLLMLSSVFTMSFLIPVFLNLFMAIGTHVAFTSPQPPPPKERQKVTDYPAFAMVCTFILKVSDSGNLEVRPF